MVEFIGCFFMLKRCICKVSTGHNRRPRDWLGPNAPISAKSVTKNSSGLSLVIIEGHHVYQNQGLIEMGDYIAWLTTSTATLCCRGCSQESLELYTLYTTRISPFIQAITKSRNIIKVSAASCDALFLQNPQTYFISPNWQVPRFLGGPIFTSVKHKTSWK